VHQTTNLERACGLIWACRFVRRGRELQSFRLIKSKRGAANDRIASPLNRPGMGNQVWTNSCFLSRNLPALFENPTQRNAMQRKPWNFCKGIYYHIGWKEKVCGSKSITFKQRCLRVGSHWHCSNIQIIWWSNIDAWRLHE
jgi:hypothetical protein